MPRHNSKEDEKIILINQLYTGAYLKEGYNVGHEVINLIPTKDNEHYLYITPKGTIKDKKKADKIESVIFVQHISKGKLYEIVGIATELTRTNKEYKNDGYKDDENIEYGNDSINASLQDIFSTNTYQGQSDVTEAYTTFKAENVRVPKAPITIILSPDTPKNSEDDDKSNGSNTNKEDTEAEESDTEEKNEKTIEIKFQNSNNEINNNDEEPTVKTTMNRLVPQSMRRYISSKSEKELYNLLNKIISEESCWKNIDDSNLKEMKAPEDPTYLELIGKTFDELSYSNLIAYYLKYSPKGFYEFFKEFFADSADSAFTADNAEDNEHSKISYSVTRERYINCDSDKGGKSLRGRADIWIEGEYKNKKFLILIENKIKSGIKDTSDENVTQLDLYKRAIEKELKDSPNLLYCLVLLVPNYYESTHPEFKKDKSYKVIRYSGLFDFFERNSTEYKEAPYFKDFKRCLERQTESEGQATYNIMKERFIHRIIQVSEKNRAK